MLTHGAALIGAVDLGRRCRRTGMDAAYIACLRFDVVAARLARHHYRSLHALYYYALFLAGQAEYERSGSPARKARWPLR